MDKRPTRQRLTWTKDKDLQDKDLQDNRPLRTKYLHRQKTYWTIDL